MIKLDSGICKGLKLQTAEGFTRPTLAKIRGSILNSLQSRLADGARILDLFAGSGAMGIDAVSRGASAATFVESERRVFKILEENVELCRQRCVSGAQDSVLHALKGNVLSLESILASRSEFDIIFCDPPYAETKLILPQLVKQISKFCSAEAIWVLEFQKKSLTADDLVVVKDSGWQIDKEKNFGDTTIQFFEFKGKN